MKSELFLLFDVFVKLNFKTEYIYKNQLWTICTYMGLWFEGNKMGSSKNCFLGSSMNCFLDSRYHYQEVENIFANISAKTKYFPNILGCDSRDNILSIHEKNRLQKFHATVHLTRIIYAVCVISMLLKVLYIGIIHTKVKKSTIKQI